MTQEEIKSYAKGRAQDLYCRNENNMRQYKIAQIHAFTDGFLDGAEWRIKKVWHDVSEIPISGKESLVKYITGDLKIKYRVDVFCGCEWKEMCHYDKLLQFAYIEDLLPNKED